MKKPQDLLTEEEQKRLYLVHHMHHFKYLSNRAKHEIHHCFLFYEKNMKGDKYEIKHLLVDEKLFHVLNKLFSGYLYNHLNNSFKINIRQINNKKYSIIE